MPVRITSASAQTNYVFVGFGAGIFLAAAIALIESLEAASVFWGLFSVVWIGFAARSFRGEGEAVEPSRPWWRMTAGPTTGFIVAGLYISQALILSRDPILGSATDDAMAVLMGLIGGLFAYSSVRLSLQQGRKSGGG